MESAIVVSFTWLVSFFFVAISLPVSVINILEIIPMTVNVVAFKSDFAKYTITFTYMPIHKILDLFAGG